MSLKPILQKNPFTIFASEFVWNAKCSQYVLFWVHWQNTESTLHVSQTPFSNICKVLFKQNAMLFVLFPTCSSYFFIHIAKIFSFCPFFAKKIALFSMHWIFLRNYFLGRELSNNHQFLLVNLLNPLASISCHTEEFAKCIVRFTTTAGWIHVSWIFFFSICYIL